MSRAEREGRVAEVALDTPCVIWHGNLNAAGYGRKWVREDGQWRLRYVHRVAWAEAHGPIPDGVQIDHRCFTRACYNLEHLEAITGDENTRRAGARVTHCPQGHEYTPENTHYKPRGNGHRACKTCHRDKERARKQRKAALR